MKTVVLSLADPWLMPHGGTLRTRALVSALAELGHDVVTVFPVSDDEQNAPAGSPNGSRATSPVGGCVVAVDGKTVGNRAWPPWVKRVKRALIPMPTSLGSRSWSLVAALRDLVPVDFLVVSTLPFARYRNELPRAQLWVDHSDLYSDVIAREATRRPRLAQATARLQHTAAVRLENRLTTIAAITTAAGYTDAHLLQARTGRSIAWLPTPVSCREVPRVPSRRPVAGFFANFNYWPNVDAFNLLQHRWAPRLTAMGWKVLVAGLSSDRLDHGADITIVGPVDSPEEFYREVDITVAPIRVGGGMKVKVVESLAHGRPVIATEFAVAGFPESLATYVRVVDTNEPEFAWLAAGPPALPSTVQQGLEPFSAASFRERVASLIARSAVPAMSSDISR